ncbi:MAG: CPBP family intramembrane metalloprotease [Clostridiales bacterium]|nr:CPBP family intramembrane metalloprotease [Clostridiales bacterium]
MIKKILTTDPSYKQMTMAYNKIEAVLAVGLYICVIVLYLAAGYIGMISGSNLIAIFANVLLAAMVLVIIRIRKQKFSTVGFTLSHFKRSLIIGAVAGLILSICANIIPTILSGGQWMGFDSIPWNFFYMLVIIAFIEELVFRGYIQTRLYGAIKSDAAAVIVGSVLFMGMHIPFQLFNRNDGNLIDFFAANSFWLLTTLVMHLLFNFLYRKYNSLISPTICHFLVNFGSTLFG